MICFYTFQEFGWKKEEKSANVARKEDQESGFRTKKEVIKAQNVAWWPHAEQRGRAMVRK